MKKKSRQYLIPSYGRQQYGFGSWLKKSAGAIGTVAGLGLAAAAAPFTGGTSLLAAAPLLSAGAMAGSAIGGSIQNNYTQEQSLEYNSKMQADATAQQNAVIAAQNQQMARNTMAQNRLNGVQQQNFGGAQFANGGIISSYKNGGGVTLQKNDAYRVRSVNGVPYDPAIHGDKRLPSQYKNNKTKSDPYIDAAGNKYFISQAHPQMDKDPDVRYLGGNAVAYTNPKNVEKYGNMKVYDMYDDKISFSGGANKYQHDMNKRVLSNDFIIDTLPQIQSLPFMQKPFVARDYSSYGDPREMKANGGFMEAVNKNPDVTYFATGGTHNQNPYGGIPIGPDATVEQGEFKVKLNGKDYIFTNRF